MTLAELRSELERRDLSLSGTKAALEMRLAQALVVEIMGGDAAAAAMQMQMGTGAEEQKVRLRRCSFTCSSATGFPQQTCRYQQLHQGPATTAKA